jgi:hypothetical protein
MATEIKVEKIGDNMVITIPTKNPPRPSASGKSLVVASTNGNVVTDLMVNGKPVIVGLNAYIKS